MHAQVTLTGHKGAVTAMRYNASGAMLASGAQDTDVILWDVVGEPGLFRLRGQNVLVSGGKDGYLRAWDLATQHCFQTLTGLQGEVRRSATWCLASLMGTMMETLHTQSWWALPDTRARQGQGAPSLR